jgi:hypothetical protein
MDVLDVLDDPRAGAAEFNALLPRDVCEDVRDILRMSNFQPRRLQASYHTTEIYKQNITMTSPGIVGNPNWYPGYKGTGGRPKGSRNRRTEEILDLIENCADRETLRRKLRTRKNFRQRSVLPNGHRHPDSCCDPAICPTAYPPPKRCDWRLRRWHQPGIVLPSLASVGPASFTSLVEGQWIRGSAQRRLRLLALLVDLLPSPRRLQLRGKQTCLRHRETGGFDPMYGPAVRSKKISASLG